MKKVLLLLTLIAAAFSAAQAQRAKSVLLAGEAAGQLAKQCSRPSPADYIDTWTPTKEQIAEMEAKFADIAKLKVKSCCIEGAKVANPDEWYMQYAPLVWQNKKVIYISGISTTEPPAATCFDYDSGGMTKAACDWKKRAIVICDGGKSWGVIYDVESRKFTDLTVNGVG